MIRERRNSFTELALTENKVVEMEVPHAFSSKLSPAGLLCGQTYVIELGAPISGVSLDDICKLIEEKFGIEYAMAIHGAVRNVDYFEFFATCYPEKVTAALKSLMEL